MFVCLSACLSVNFLTVKDFSGTTLLRILKFGTKLDMSVLCKRESATYGLSVPLFVHFFLSNKKILSQISQLLLEPGSSDFVYILRVAKCTV